METPGTRATQLADLIRDHLARWIHRDNAGFFVSVNQVTLTPDLKRATAWISVFPKGEQGKVLQSLRKSQGRYSKELRKVISRHTLPLLSFSIDTSAEDEARIDDLLK